MNRDLLSDRHVPISRRERMAVARLVPTLQHGGNVGVAEASVSLETAKRYFEALGAKLAVAAKPGRNERGEHTDPLIVECFIPLCAAFVCLQQGKKLPDFLLRHADALKSCLEQVHPLKRIVLHEGQPVWEDAPRQDGKESA